MACVDGVWRVPIDHPAFAGHFPGRPIVPGVVLLDRAVWLAEKRDEGRSGNWTVVQAKFLRPCGPGDALTFDLNADPRGGYAFVVRRGDSDVAMGLLVFEPT